MSGSIRPRTNLFKRAVAFRMTPDADPAAHQGDRLPSALSALTRNFTEYRGYWLPNRFTKDGPIDEYWACRERCGGDRPLALRKFEVLGPDAETLLQRTLTRNVRKLAVGQVVYSAMCYEHGGMLDDGTLFRLGPDNFRWIGGDEYERLWLREQAAEAGPATSGCKLRDRPDPQPRGPGPDEPRDPEAGRLDAAGADQRSTSCTGSASPSAGSAISTASRSCVSRTGYTGELGYEVFCHPKDAPTVWDAVMEAGKPHGIAPMGLEALDMVRIEAGLVFAGYEFTTRPIRSRPASASRCR